MRGRGGWRAALSASKFMNCLAAADSPRETFDAVEGLMLRFSPGFYVGSMKNVPLALLAGNTITNHRHQHWYDHRHHVVAPALAFRAFRRCETCF